MTEIIIIAVTVLLSGFFSGSEMAFVTANRLKVEIESRRNSLQGRSIAFFSENPSTFLTTTLVGNNIVNVLYATLMAIYLAEPIQHFYNTLLGAMPSDGVVLLIQTIFASILILLFGEIVPKAIFRIQADFMVRAVAVPLRILNFVLKPLIMISNSASGFLVKLFSVGSERSDKVFRR